MGYLATGMLPKFQKRLFAAQSQLFDVLFDDSCKTLEKEEIFFLQELFEVEEIVFEEA